MVQIIQLEDRRVACDSLRRFLRSPEPKIRARAVEAMGKLQDPTCVDVLLDRLRDENHNVRLEAVFALGQIGDQRAEGPLLTFLNRQDKMEVKKRVVEALGKLGNQSTLPALIRLLSDKNTDLLQATALAAARLARRGLKAPALTDSLSVLLQHSNEEVRWKACYALMRIGEGLDARRFRSAVRDRDPRVRMYAVRVLGQLQDIPSLERLGALLRKDPDWRVRVSTARALGEYPLSQSAPYLTLFNQTGHVRRAILEAIGRSALNEPAGYEPNSREHNMAKYQLEQVLLFEPSSNGGEESEPVWTESEIGAALIAYGRLLGDEALSVLTPFTQDPRLRVRVRAIQALAETHSARAARALEKQYPNAPTPVKVAILEALDKLRDVASPDIFRQALNETDHVLVALAAQALGRDSLNSRIYVQPILSAYERLPKPVDSETTLMIFEALGKIRDRKAVPFLQRALRLPDKVLSRAAAQALVQITGVDTFEVVQATEPHLQYDYADLAALRGARAFIKTRRGTIEIALFADDAPVTVLNFVRLAERGFYDRLSFHRVVPNFVIQGGDPRGDGWGSPGYAIRSEFNKRPFLRGTVGMASAGKDTEGCQFFITHSPQPHLDGRYTVFGQVVSGQEVVDAIDEGEIMELVTIQR